jgi:hypothetical protein
MESLTTSDLVGFIGVFILLVAFLLNLVGKLSQDSPGYLLLNFVGAGLACLASVLISYLPFVILEGVWALVSLIGLLRKLRD